MLGNFLLGACAFATAHAAQRMIAPFAGLGLTLHVAVLSASLLGFSLGCILSASIRPVERLSPLGGRVLLVPAVLTLALIALRRPLLESLGQAELRVAVTVACRAVHRPALRGIGFAFAEATPTHAAPIRCAASPGCWPVRPSPHRSRLPARAPLRAHDHAHRDRRLGSRRRAGLGRAPGLAAVHRGSAAGPRRRDARRGAAGGLR
jgi:hypothetical protein